MHDVQSDRAATVVSAGMSPYTVHLIAQEIRHFRAFLTVRETWAQQQEKCDSISETFRWINFWRRQLKRAEDELSRQKTT